MIKNYCVNLNIHYSLVFKDYPKSILELYRDIDGWIDNEAYPCWYGKIEDEEHITVSVEPGGLQIISKIDESKWRFWLKDFKEKATIFFGYEIGEPEDGYEFKVIL